MWLHVLINALLIGVGNPVQPPKAVQIGVIHSHDLSPLYHPVLNYARDLINHDGMLLPETRLEFTYKDPGTTSYDVLRNAVSVIRGEDNNGTAPVAIIGASYSGNTKVVASACAAYGLPNVVLNDVPDLSNKVAYPNSMRLWPTIKAHSEALKRLMLEMNWKRVILLYGEDEVGLALNDFMSHQTDLEFTRVSFTTFTDADRVHNNDPLNLSSSFVDSIERAVLEVASSPVNILIVYTEFGAERLWQTLYKEGVIPDKQVVTVAQMLGSLPSDDSFQKEAAPGIMWFGVPPMDWSWPPLWKWPGPMPLFTFQIPVLSSMLFVARALHSLLYINQTGLESIRGETLLNEMRQTAIRDAWDPQGEVHLDDFGDRPIDLTLYNLQPPWPYGNITGTWYWKEETLELDKSSMMFSDGTNVPPDDFTIIFEYRLLTVPDSLKAAIYTLVGLSLAVALSLLAFNMKKRRSQVIRMSSPNFNNAIIVGGMLLMCTSFATMRDTTTLSENDYVNVCYIDWWMSNIGFTLFFGSLLVKTFRVWVIFRSRDIGVVSVPDSRLAIMLSILLLFDIVVLSLRTWAVPLHYDGRSQYLEKLTNSAAERLYWDSCSSNHDTIFALIVAIEKILLVMLGCFLAVVTRHVSIPVLNDSHLIGFCIYNVFILGGIVVGLNMLLRTSISQATLNGAVALRQCGQCIIAVSSMCLLFLPKMYHVIRGHEASLTTPKMPSIRTRSVPSDRFTSVHSNNGTSAAGQTSGSTQSTMSGSSQNGAENATAGAVEMSQQHRVSQSDFYEPSSSHSSQDAGVEDSSNSGCASDSFAHADV